MFLSKSRSSNAPSIAAWNKLWCLCLLRVKMQGSVGIVSHRLWGAVRATYCLSAPRLPLDCTAPVQWKLGVGDGGRGKNLGITSQYGIIPVRKIIRFTFIFPKPFCIWWKKILLQILSFLRIFSFQNSLKASNIFKLEYFSRKKVSSVRRVIPETCLPLGPERKASVLHPKSRVPPTPFRSASCRQGSTPLISEARK